MQLTINETPYTIPETPDRPLLWVLRDELGLTGTKFGCGLGICGCCTVLVDDAPTRACITQLSSLQGKSIRTIEGLADSDGTLHPVQQAFIEQQVPQCGWCMPGQMVTAANFLETNPQPTEEEIRRAMSTVYCRCGTYYRIRKAVARAAEMAASTAGNLSPPASDAEIQV